jgi:Amidohydrolase family
VAWARHGIGASNGKSGCVQPSPTSARSFPGIGAPPSSRATRSSLSTTSAGDVQGCDVVIDADGATAIPGLIDSHVHVTFGDYTPRQQTVGYLESYVHGGVTTAISASEVHVPGRPRDAEGVKALAVAARKCFEHYRPGGMTVHAGSIILEPGLTGNDLGEVAKKGVWLAKAGFGAFPSAYEYGPLIAAARAARHDYDGAHRRIFNSRLGRDHRRPLARA